MARSVIVYLVPNTRWGILSCSCLRWGVLSCSCLRWGILSCSCPRWGILSCFCPRWGILSCSCPRWGFLSCSCPRWGILSCSCHINLKKDHIGKVLNTVNALKKFEHLRRKLLHEFEYFLNWRLSCCFRWLNRKWLPPVRLAFSYKTVKKEL